MTGPVHARTDHARTDHARTVNAGHARTVNAGPCPYSHSWSMPVIVGPSPSLLVLARHCWSWPYLILVLAVSNTGPGLINLGQCLINLGQCLINLGQYSI